MPHLDRGIAGKAGSARTSTRLRLDTRNLLVPSRVRHVGQHLVAGEPRPRREWRTAWIAFDRQDRASSGEQRRGQNRRKPVDYPTSLCASGPRRTGASLRRHSVHVPAAAVTRRPLLHELWTRIGIGARWYPEPHTGVIAHHPLRLVEPNDAVGLDDRGVRHGTLLPRRRQTLGRELGRSALQNSPERTRDIPPAHLWFAPLSEVKPTHHPTVPVRPPEGPFPRRRRPLPQRPTPH